MSDYICEEIVVDILKRLSIDDAVRCTAVCKSWYSLITSPSFISLHSQHHLIGAVAASTNKSLALVRVGFGEAGKEHYSLRFDDELFQEHKSLVFPFATHCSRSFFRVVGCVNGVVRVAYLERDIISRKVVPRVEVYESRIGSSRSVDAKGFPFIIDHRSRQAFLNGKVHWVMGSEDRYKDFNSQSWLMRGENQFKYLMSARRSNNLIVSFDLTSEVFKLMNVPDSTPENPPQQLDFFVENVARHDFNVSVLGESLSLIHHHDWLEEYGQSCCIWVMKEYGVPDSWTKLFNVDVDIGLWRLVGLRRDGEALLMAVLKYPGPAFPGLISPEPKSRRVNPLVRLKTWNSVYVDNFVESLALIGVKRDSSVTSKLADEHADGSNGSRDENRRTESADLPTSENLTPVWGRVEVQLFS